MKQFIAIDGEGYTNEQGEHIYNLIGDSTGSYIIDNEGLPTLEIFTYLLDLKARYPDAVFVSFFFSYDVNMLLRTVPRAAVEKLASGGRCYIQAKRNKKISYNLIYIPRKQFTLAIGSWKESGNARSYNTIQRLTIFDVFGFFQCSFVTAMENLKVGTEEEIERLKAMKLERSVFSPDDMSEILEYNKLECKLLVDAMEKLETALTTCDLKLNRYDGAGAIAGSIFKKFNCKNHIENPKNEMIIPTLHGYFGGRIQALTIGEYNQKIYTYDIVSAYPSILVNLPSLKDHSFKNVKNPSKEYLECSPYTICKVVWENCCSSIQPFPVRLQDGAIVYPYSGEGWYWEKEVIAALLLYKENIHVAECYTIIPNNVYKPFDFIYDLFEQRKKFKREGNYAQLPLKLGLNSLYGKTAQSIGFGGTKPSYQSYILAGIITSETRAKLLTAVIGNEDKIISFATDGICSTVPLNLDIGTSLGQWEASSLDGLLILKPGFYTALNVKAEPCYPNKVRGFMSRDIDYNFLLEQWRLNDLSTIIETTSHRFVMMKNRNKSWDWCSWVDLEKKLSFLPERGYPLAEENEEGLKRFRMLPPMHRGISKAYDSAQFRKELSEDIY